MKSLSTNKETGGKTRPPITRSFFPWWRLKSPNNLPSTNVRKNWSRQPRGLSRGSVAARLLGLWFRIPPGAWMSVSCVVCCQVEVSASGWSLVQRRTIECPFSMRDCEASTMRRPRPTRGRRARKKNVMTNSTKRRRRRHQSYETKADGWPCDSTSESLWCSILLRRINEGGVPHWKRIMTQPWAGRLQTGYPLLKTMKDIRWFNFRSWVSFAEPGGCVVYVASCMVWTWKALVWNPLMVFNWVIPVVSKMVKYNVTIYNVIIHKFTFY
jgi:hypothetical protein